MKIAVCSDLHLEFGDLDLKNEDGADVLILSGDICVEQDLDMFDRRQTEMGFARQKSVMLHEFFTRVSEQFPHVIYVAGNHEHYHGDFKFTLNELKRKLAHLTNVHVLDKEVFELEDTVFIGGTLWTDMNKEDPMTLHAIRTMMNDFRCVKNSNRVVSRTVPIYEYDSNGSVARNEAGQQIQIGTKRKEDPSTFCPEDAVVDHRAMLDYIKTVYQDIPPWKQVVIVGHHSPSKQSTHPRYASEELMNGGYSSDLTEFMLDRPAIKLWTHGHTHEDFDYMIGDCRVVCNPRGYIKYEPRADRFKLKVVEL
jgi:predicted phosphodiesterase